MQLEKQVDKLVNQILLKAENQHELLFGDCQSGVAITNTQEHILMLLSQERLTNSDLAKRLNISQAAVTKAIKYLVSQGMLASVKNKEDARVTYFELTDIAKPVAKEHTHHHDATLAVYKNLFNQFSEDEQDVIARFLKVFSDELEGRE
ncbi:DNA-binding transcriptional regulator, MarR family [Streptococcus gallolyticus]|uniref:DNA-binding transcriptional regulator, MarR family n=2 Tax=Streptococcus gallolyticus TaxID=315405 RepID=A0A060RIX7_9STRE|nr:MULTISPECIES: zinc-dependent MarR family transcriptional regulator [Streptococcus]AQP41079.1 MarR family transcriptional regulator [Streptococcus gallolyticus subsp. gallolyticus DSM 16831]MCQ9216535.1 zinc-dependent MarR family transcriptional regulator [Streptococcus gallolyticus]MCR5053069.1 zinc-dependent MarR family transcriptional regulator [Streptococcus sp.]MCY7166506.1 zinc-dependent MarR family transcriptional regulator [Streptococcus gallolyticus subsp. gallolyticus]MCY7183887.1 